jgi:hypothetical protein
MANTVSSRVFINSDDTYYQIYSFTQSDDGSIYCGSQDFSSAKWIGIDTNRSNIDIKLADNIGDGKISIHGTGMAAIRPHLDPQGHQIIIKGNKLLNPDRNEIGIRHLFTTFIKEPSYIPPNSPVFNRHSDSILKSSEDLKPLVFIFFAVPQQNLTVNFQMSIDMDLLNNIPGDFLGLGNISLKYHAVIWFAYRTNHMDKWPKYSHYIYSDGYMFPLFIGIEPGRFAVDIRMPTYQIFQNILTISV